MSPNPAPQGPIVCAWDRWRREGRAKKITDDLRPVASPGGAGSGLGSGVAQGGDGVRGRNH